MGGAIVSRVRCLGLFSPQLAGTIVLVFWWCKSFVGKGKVLVGCWAQQQQGLGQIGFVKGVVASVNR